MFCILQNFLDTLWISDKIWWSFSKNLNENWNKFAIFEIDLFSYFLNLFFSLKSQQIMMNLLMIFLGRSGEKECKADRFRQEFSKEYLVAKVGFDSAENEPSEVCQKGVR